MMEGFGSNYSHDACSHELMVLLEQCCWLHAGVAGVFIYGPVLRHPERFPLFSILPSPPVCRCSAYLSQVSPVSPDLFMIPLLISFTMTLESASQIKILQAKCAPCTVHSKCMFVCSSQIQRGRHFHWFGEDAPK